MTETTPEPAPETNPQNAAVNADLPVTPAPDVAQNAPGAEPVVQPEQPEPGVPVQPEQPVADVNEAPEETYDAGNVTESNDTDEVVDGNDTPSDAAPVQNVGETTPDQTQ